MPFDSKLKVGVLGGGQLSQMLVDAALSLKLSPTVLVDDGRAPATRRACHVIVGDLKKFLNACDVVAFENEFLDTETLANAKSAARFLPQLSAIKILQDKLSQKELFTELALPTAAFATFAELPQDGVLKWSRQGYDGKGVHIISEERAAAADFVTEGRARGARVYVEERVDFATELALTATRSADGAIAYYPLVISEQSEGICRYVEGPARQFAGEEITAQDYARRLGEKMDLVGSFTLEFFLSRDGELLVNEVAPRVHNSAHYSQNACEVDQFHNHWRVLLGGAPAEPRPAPYFAMANLIGPSGYELADADFRCPPVPDGLYLHWYGKSHIRPARKMGHVNLMAKTESEFFTKKLALKSYVKTWEQSVRNCVKNST